MSPTSICIWPRAVLSHVSTRPRSQKSSICLLPVPVVASMHVHVGYIEWDRWRFCFPVHVQLRPDSIIAPQSLACWRGEALVALSTSLSGLAYPQRTVSISQGGGGPEPTSSKARQVVPTWACFPEFHSVCLVSVWEDQTPPKKTQFSSWVCDFKRTKHTRLDKLKHYCVFSSRQRPSAAARLFV